MYARITLPQIEEQGSSSCMNRCAEIRKKVCDRHLWPTHSKSTANHEVADGARPKQALRPVVRATGTARSIWYRLHYRTIQGDDLKIPPIERLRHVRHRPG
eukprot:6166704-Pyramimonas_sp.AAC.1